mmetsp:Transcript_21849/g.24920  ORF Transcript_21849/g.24920 Transcript_21849/m.24920 type:complete len:413 (+) Transcript_21849:112-1350(+)|eukprot:CAMPEP_0194146858 /NCGR_PEP_ID=MMETSP0152-20130528/22025_1 /TAXON_ID=1049557 /ORGANISM="Thalassiothrix antarctica, Strain L6-D1" /LENGTH=412 /DNA_ID=CAMNT_0038847495 /DNA_START=34 /DNA_END=1272 /DNA_ORIENTATION=+
MSPPTEPTTTPDDDESDDGGIKLFTITIPEGKVEGDQFTYEEEGVRLEIVVPKDKKGGDVMEILIDDNDDDIEAIMVDLGPQMGNLTLNLVTFLDEVGDLAEIIDLEELAAKTGAALAEEGEVAETDEKDDDDSDYIDEEDMDDEIDGTNYMIWPAGVELAQFLSSPYAKPLLEKKRNALELGSGVGVAGMALAAVLAKHGDSPKDTTVTMTDLPVAMSLLTANWKENEERVTNESGITVNTEKYVWGEDNSSKYDLIIGSDLLYNAEDDEEVIGKLTKTFDQCLSEGGSILLATRWRKFDKERVFFEKMDAMGYEFVDAKSRIETLGGTTSGAEEEDSYTFKSSELSWKNFGNPDNEESKKYFADTKFKINEKGDMKPLSDINELDLEVMDEADFDTCELAHIQIYVGYKK